MKKYSFIKPDYKLQRNLMAFGYECDDGWLPLIEELFNKIEKMLDNAPTFFEITQVKEKYGTLRVYAVGETEEILNLIDEYEVISSKTCEFCGKPGELRDKKHWYKTLCKKCYQLWVKNKLYLQEDET